MTNTESPRPIENRDGNLVFTGVGIDLLRSATIARALATKVSTGRDLTRPLPGRSPLQLANAVSSQLDWEAISPATSVRAPAMWAAKRTNPGALLDLVLFMVVVYGWEPTAQVRAALDEKKVAVVLRKAAKVRTALLAVSAAEAVVAAAANEG